MKELLEQVATIVADYRIDELPAPDAKHVARWLAQFERDIREPLLREMAHVLGQTYWSKSRCNEFIDNVATSDALAGDDPEEFWNGVHVLKIQTGGQSQADMLKLLMAALNNNFGIRTLPKGESGTFIYFDDISFSGNRVLQDLRPWITSSAPQTCKVHIIVMAFHNGGQYYAETELTKAAKLAGKAIEFRWWRSIEIEDRLSNIDISDVLRPTVIPQDENVEAYIAGMTHQLMLRTAGSVGEQGFFSSDTGRQLLEQEFLKAGCRVRVMCPNFKARHRPLGFMLLDTLGFGAMMVTYRNCPNNAPLALWAGDPWIPLFPRKNN